MLCFVLAWWLRRWAVVPDLEASERKGDQSQEQTLASLISCSQVKVKPAWVMDGSLEPGWLVMVLPPTLSWDVDRSHAFVGFIFHWHSWRGSSCFSWLFWEWRTNPMKHRSRKQHYEDGKKCPTYPFSSMRPCLGHVVQSTVEGGLLVSKDDTQ